MKKPYTLKDAKNAPSSTFFRVPKDWLDSWRNHGISKLASIFFWYLVNLATLSERNSKYWSDSKGIYSWCTLVETARLFGISERKATDITAELKKAGLVDVDQPGWAKRRFRIRDFDHVKEALGTGQQFYQFPYVLMDCEEYSGLSFSAKLLFVLCYDMNRKAIYGMKNICKDRFFVTYKSRDIQALLGYSPKTVTRCFQELEAFQLIERQKQGCNKADMIFVFNPYSEEYENHRSEYAEKAHLAIDGSPKESDMPEQRGDDCLNANDPQDAQHPSQSDENDNLPETDGKSDSSEREQQQSQTNDDASLVLSAIRKEEAIRMKAWTLMDIYNRNSQKPSMMGKEQIPLIESILDVAAKTIYSPKKYYKICGKKMRGKDVVRLLTTSEIDVQTLMYTLRQVANRPNSGAAFIISTLLYNREKILTANATAAANSQKTGEVTMQDIERHEQYASFILNGEEGKLTPEEKAIVVKYYGQSVAA